MIIQSKFAAWFRDSLSESEDKKYRHRLLTENSGERKEILEELVSYVQNAHEDARIYLRSILTNTLSPFSIPSAFDPAEGYPELLHMQTLKGYFGEIFAGLIAEHFAPFGETEWKVPAFLFRYHNLAFEELERIRQTGEKAKEIPGRTGDDCLAFQLNRDGRIIRYLYCEAKCTAGGHMIGMVQKAHEKAGNSVVVNLMQIIDILKSRDDPESQQFSLAIQELLLFRQDRSTQLPRHQAERCNMVSYICGKSPAQGKRSAWLSTDKPHAAYTAASKLEAIEVHLPDIEALIREVYARKPVTKETHSSIGTVSTMPSPDDIVASAKKLRETLAGTKLPPSIAKLYSQYTRLNANQPGLQKWLEKDTVARLHNALVLLEAAFVEREIGNENWTDSVRRAGALLEWLSHPQLNPKGLPLHLLAAASYQLAGYPALSSGLLGNEQIDPSESHILYFLLKAEFPRLLEQLIAYWAKNSEETEQTQTEVSWQNPEELSLTLQQQVVRQTVSALGIVCATMRWGEHAQIQQALEKLSHVGKFLLHGSDPYSWLLARLCGEVASVYVQSSLRNYVSALSQGVDEIGKRAIERYLRRRYSQNKTLAWSSQITGIKRLASGESFVLCTPTGSGKTTVAELAILQSLFLDTDVSVSKDPFSEEPAPIVLYLVPSRALATEVEASLSRVLQTLNDPPIHINTTGLYGGTDWGPTDAWLTSDERTVLICTYEKAEALIRFLGPLFLKRISLVVIDEAHSIQYNNDIAKLRKAESRSLRLESLGARLLTFLDESNGRAIALSAVASNIQSALAHWVTGNGEAQPAETSYRSTRQLVGRLECHVDRSFMIHYDLLDGGDLRFDEDNPESPYILKPVPSCPVSGTDWEKAGPEKRLRPYLLWAAMHLASQYHQSTSSGTVLISVTQDINDLAKDFLSLLGNVWTEIEKPVFFLSPQDETKKDIWQKCLRSCEDYFGNQSHEYQLLEKGIVVHHGKMPGLMARLLVQVIRERIVHIVLATSTLSEGVNLPVEVIIIPSLLRRGKRLIPYEFNNLIGRAGRPGTGTEGRCLVLLENKQGRAVDQVSQIQKAQQRYNSLIDDITGQVEVTDKEQGPQSSLAELLQYIEKEWRKYFSHIHMDFFEWLEQVAPVDITEKLRDDTGLGAIEATDTLDGMLLATIAELEQITTEPLTLSNVENHLRAIWQRSYAYYAAQNEKHLNEIFMRRGTTLWSTIYPDTTRRRRLYRTSLPPRSGNELLLLYPTIIEELKRGEEYASWKGDSGKRFEFVEKIVGQLGTLEKFKLEDKKFGRGKRAPEVRWQDILRWWLDPAAGIGPQDASEISQWYGYVYRNFIYNICWGLGSVLALAGDEVHGGVLMESTFKNWPLLQLPWIVLWLKELLTWGTLEPVAAYLLAKNIKSTRRDAEDAAELYYMNWYQPYPDELFNATVVRNWVEAQHKQKQQTSFKKPPISMKAHLLKNFTEEANKHWKVLPVEGKDEIFWLDPTGLRLAFSHKPTDWEAHFLQHYDFMLDVSTGIVSSTSYL